MTSDFVTIDTKTNEERKRREDKYWEAQWHIDSLYQVIQDATRELRKLDSVLAVAEKEWAGVQ